MSCNGACAAVVHAPLRRATLHRSTPTLRFEGSNVDFPEQIALFFDIITLAFFPAFLYRPHRTFAPYAASHWGAAGRT